MTLTAQTLFDLATWQMRNRFDKAAVALADRHYSREARGTPQVGGPGRVLIFVTPCERAVWITRYHVPECNSPRAIGDGFDAWRCSIFRNEGAGRSSDLIRAAMNLTQKVWKQRGLEEPRDGWVTWVDRTKVNSAHPGYCFKQAGWWLDREWSHPRLIRLRAMS